ncbi:MAG: DUF4342 domain-containing protein [Chloroflexi bacterium]|nr:MAG: DUF4342 domain-containing protein [Chloroflexota bacterium]
MPNNENGEPESRRTFTEEIEVAGNELVDRIKELVEEGNVRRVIIRNQDDNVLLEVPLTIGVVAGGAVALFAPVLAAIGALAALVARVKVEIVREAPADSERKEKVEISSEE